MAIIKKGLQKKIKLGIIDAKIDWGHARYYVKAMWLILQQENPDTFVIATNETHSVQEFAELAFDCVDLNYKDFIEVDNRFLRPADVNYLRGDYSKAKRILDWKPETTYSELVDLMVNEDLQRWERWKLGEHFPWDAFNYPNENKILSRMLKFDK